MAAEDLSMRWSEELIKLQAVLVKLQERQLEE